MPEAPVIAFGQQPCGFFPARLLVAKIRTALRLREELGGKVVFFYHDSDHDPRETRTLLRNKTTGKTERINFQFAGKLQKNHAPLYAKRIAGDWKPRTRRQLPKYAGTPAIEAFDRADAGNPADFCLQIYRSLGLLDAIEVVRSSDPQRRREAVRVNDFFADIDYRGELVRARVGPKGQLLLHRGGGHFIELPPREIAPEQISPTRDTRLRWMQSVLKCTHYVAGLSEQAYLNPEETPEITFVPRDEIDRANEAFTDEFSTFQDPCLRGPSR